MIQLSALHLIGCFFLYLTHFQGSASRESLQVFLDAYQIPHEWWELTRQDAYFVVVKETAMLRHPHERCNFRQHFDNTLTRSPRQKSVFAHVEDVLFYLDTFPIAHTTLPCPLSGLSMQLKISLGGRLGSSPLICELPCLHVDDGSAAQLPPAKIGIEGLSQPGAAGLSLLPSFGACISPP